VSYPRKSYLETIIPFPDLYMYDVFNLDKVFEFFFLLQAEFLYNILFLTFTVGLDIITIHRQK